MIEIFQEREIELFFDVAVLFAHGEVCGEVDGKLFVADGMFENALVGGFERRHALLLELFAAAQIRETAAHVVVGAHPRYGVRTPHRLELRTRHQDDAQTRIGIDRVLIVGFYEHLFPFRENLIRLLRLAFKGIHTLPPALFIAEMKRFMHLIANRAQNCYNTSKKACLQRFSDGTGKAERRSRRKALVLHVPGLNCKRNKIAK